MDKRKMPWLIIRLVVIFAAYLTIGLILIVAGFNISDWQYWAIMATVAVVHLVA